VVKFQSIWNDFISFISKLAMAMFRLLSELYDGDLEKKNLGIDLGLFRRLRV